MTKTEADDKFIEWCKNVLKDNALTLENSYNVCLHAVDLKDINAGDSAQEAGAHCLAFLQNVNSLELCAPTSQAEVILGSYFIQRKSYNEILMPSSNRGM